MDDSISIPSNILEIMQYIALILSYRMLLPNHKCTIGMLFGFMEATHEPFVWNGDKWIAFESLFHRFLVHSDHDQHFHIPYIITSTHHSRPKITKIPHTPWIMQLSLGPCIPLTSRPNSVRSKYPHADHLII
jgi:hypothetical protein